MIGQPAKIAARVKYKRNDGTPRTDIMMQSTAAVEKRPPLGNRHCFPAIITIPMLMPHRFVHLLDR